MSPAPNSPPEITAEGTTTASGLQYFEVESGSGAQPSASDTVLVHYTGWLHSNGKKFDSSHDRGQPASFPLNGVVKGFSEGIALMKEGGKARLIFPPELGYGAQGAGGGLIPANATLIFDVELVKVQ